MSWTLNKLDDMVLAAFEQAFLEGQMEIAEHLLAALEGLERHGRVVVAPEFQPKLAHAYSIIAKTAQKPSSVVAR